MIFMMPNAKKSWFTTYIIKCYETKVSIIVFMYECIVKDKLEIGKVYLLYKLT